MKKIISKGISFAKNNPQILSTLALMVVIPLAFIFSGEQFLKASRENQERLEKERIGILGDAFSLLAAERLEDPEFLQRTMEKIAEENESLEAFAVTEIIKGENIIIASLSVDDIGSLDAENAGVYEDFEGVLKRSSLIIPTRENGERHWRGYRAILDQGGETVGYIMADISMNRIDDLAERSMIRAYLILALIILAIFFLLIRQARIIDYAALYRRLEEADRMKDDFLAMAAHELRSPLTVIRGYADILKKITGLSPENREYLERIDISAAGLVSLIGDILDVSRLEQGRMKFELEEVRINEVLAPVVESFKMSAQEKGLALFFESASDVKIIADAERLKQVMVNVIGNAIKYTKEGEVRAKLSTERKKDGKKLVVRVSDTGTGISAEDQAHMFEKFFRVKSEETREIQGTGLGLWITREIVRQMRGEISIESIRGKGTDVVLAFPLVDSESIKE